MSQNINDQSANELLVKARERLKQESNGLQTKGRPLTEKEKNRIDIAGRAVDLINQAINELGGDEDTSGW